jgi:uncharacterized membrane protein HdeD (DUF308 family)
MDRTTGVPLSTVVGTFASNWWLFVLRGVAAVVFGVVSLALPGVSLTALAIVFGIYALVDGVGSIVSAFRHRDDGGHRALHALEGIVAIVAGVISLLLPQVTALALVVLLGIWAIATGAAEVSAAIRLRREITGEWLLGATGVVSIATGFLILLWPNAGAVAIAWLIGVYAIVFGIALIWIGVRLRRMLPAPRVAGAPTSA